MRCTQTIELTAKQPQILLLFFSRCEPGSKLPALGMVIQPLIGNPCNGYINPYYWVDDHPLLYGNNGSLDPIAHVTLIFQRGTAQGEPAVSSVSEGVKENRSHIP